MRSDCDVCKMAYYLHSLVFALLGLLRPHSTDATKGVDVSRLLYNFDFKDFMEAGIDGFVIFQGYRSDATVNPYAINNSIGAYEAGFTNFDTYLSPCPRCNKAAAQQVQEMGKLDITVTFDSIVSVCVFSEGPKWSILWTYLA